MARDRKKDASETVTGPRGEQFEVVGRAGPVRQMKAAPSIAAEAGGELLVVKHGEIFVCSAADGDINPSIATGQGLYSHDTRYLSELRLGIGGKPPVLLSSSAGLGYKAFVDVTNPALSSDDGQSIPQMTLNIRRIRLISDRLYERIIVRNHRAADASTFLELHLASDFADMFEIRGVRKRMSRGHALAPKTDSNTIQFAYVGEDDCFRQSMVEFDAEPEAIEVVDGRVAVRWPIELGPGEAAEFEMTVEPSLDGSRKRRRTFDNSDRKVRAESEQWQQSCTEIEPLHRSFTRVVDASIRDLRALATPIDGGAVITAGIPWYVAPFGRDSLITCYEMMLLNPYPARDALAFLARHQAKADDPLRDAEPGKILHELRSGELARAGYVPHTPYYGTVDATPLFLMLAAAYYRWTADLETLIELRPALDAALSWIDEHGDMDGDGFVEYQRRSPAGLANQCWKDSEDSIVHGDGSLAEGPLALVEVQGYVYMAKVRIAEVYAAFGEEDRAEDLRKEAQALREGFNAAFWMPDEGTFALALDGSKKQVRSVASNPGHCLYCDIVDPDKASAVAERLMAPDMFSGWGVRTLSSDHKAYNPMSYHNGSVWPHDNAIIAAGLKRFGHKQATQQIATALFEAALESREARLPELYCGFSRTPDVPFVEYPVACKPQAWAAAVPFMILQSMLGISARAPDGLLTVNQPDLPHWLGRMELRGIRIADSRISLAFTRDEDATSFSLIEREGPIKVSIQE